MLPSVSVATSTPLPLRGVAHRRGLIHVKASLDQTRTEASRRRVTTRIADTDGIGKCQDNDMPESRSAPDWDGRSYAKVSFYFAAHQDDWQLFMNPSAFEAVSNAANKVAFVHVTAGDAGLGTGTGGRKQPLYLARENGAEAAIRFMADADGFPVDQTAARASFNGHAIYRVSYRNTVTYFLRLPDGDGTGAGYPGTHYQSLKRLAGRDIETLEAIDGSTVYGGWADLVATVRAILDFERGPVSSVQLHVPETDSRRNPDDHSDHLMTAKVALDAASALAARRVYHVGYASAGLPENLSGRRRDMKCAVYAVTLAGVLALDHRIAWPHYAEAFGGRTYFRVEEP